MKKDEAYWTKNHPIAPQIYQGRPLPNGERFGMDVRHFIWPQDLLLLEKAMSEGLIMGDGDQTAHAIQQYVISSLKYVSDKSLGCAEYWLFPGETLEMCQGDCEDGAILIASMLLNSLPPEDRWRVRVAAGWVQEAPTAPQGGHGYCCYCRETDNEWVVLDWCYLPDPSVPVKEKVLHKMNEPYKDVWFSFNHEHSWVHQHFHMEGRARDLHGESK